MESITFRLKQKIYQYYKWLSQWTKECDGDAMKFESNLCCIQDNNTINSSEPYRGGFEIHAVCNVLLSRGDGVDTYCLDSGIRLTHNVFINKQVRIHPTYVGYKDIGNHGTAVSAIMSDCSSDSELSILKMGDTKPDTKLIQSTLQQLIIRHKNRRDEGKCIRSVVNMSWNLDYRYPSIEKLIKETVQEGIVPVVCAGNQGHFANHTFPANLPYVITVGSCDRELRLARYSNFGKFVDIWAIGVNVITPSNRADNDYMVNDGTSFSAPLVAGVVACLLTEEPHLTINQIKEGLRGMAQHVGYNPLDEEDLQPVYVLPYTTSYNL